MPTPDFSKIWASNSPLPEYTFSDADYVTGWDFVGSAPPTKNEFDAWFKLVDTKLNWLYNQMRDTASKLYPVGSVYISFNSADPSTLFGGTWTRLKDTFLLASGDAYAAGSTGGSATKTIAVSNMPSHNHTVNASGNHNHTATTSTAGNHSHTATTSTAGNHSHTRGSMEITGSITSNDHTGSTPEVLTDSDEISSVGALSVGNAVTVIGFKRSGHWDNVGYRTINFKASSGWTGSTSTAGNHTHTLTTSTNGNHTHTLTTATDGNHTHTTNNTGGGLPLNIMPPYQTVYMWRRTA